MKCEKCNKREATTHVTRIINGYKEEYHLCSKCAAEQNGFKESNPLNFGISDFLTGIITGGKQSQIAGEHGIASCPTCNMTYNEFLKTGRLGCGDCYTAFGDRLIRPIRQIHQATEHLGKIPKRGGGSVMLNKKISELEAKLKDAVNKQEFEEAAKLRDEIKDLKNGNNKEEA